jgi:uncharacterized protein YyaL (SSP411 family)
MRPLFLRWLASFGLSFAFGGLLFPPNLALGREPPGAVSRQHTNRLIHEKSPYLLQHAHNPVDWYPWGEEAFARARQESRIIFLSIGYSTCHWCHVMERESFEDPEVAAVLNANFVAIKVDREERPDIDQVYMSVCQALTGGGGWPLTILMTPDQVPFFAGTYIPKKPRYGRIGLVDLLQQAATLWTEQPEELRTSGTKIIEALRRASRPSGSPTPLDKQAFASAVRVLEQRFDDHRGGFGPPPKFPRPHNLTFLIRRHRRTGDSSPLRMAETTLDAMRRGGVFDHVGSGFHRYSTDAEWLVPHFEKMLYDQAGLALAYTEAYRATGKKEYARTAREIVTYVLRDMTDERGGFYSAEDADSEGEEGKFYVWTRKEILEVLGPREGELFSALFDVKEKGNFRDEATREVTGTNILNLKRSLSSSAKTMGLSLQALTERIEASRRRLFARREERVRPHRDDKVITAWNGLMISALARSGRALGEPRFLAAAARAADFIWSEMRPAGRLLRRYRDGEAAIPAFAEDYAFLARGLLDLYQATFDANRLRQALELAGQLHSRFGDPSGGGLYDTAADSERLVLRPRAVYDGAIPSANSVALEVFATLSLLTGDHEWADRAQNVLQAFSRQVGDHPTGYPQFLQGAALILDPTREVVVSGPAKREDTQALLQAVWETYAPETVALLRPATDAAGQIAKLAPFASGMKPVRGAAAAYVCQNFTCQQPLTDPAQLRSTLANPP